MQNLEKGDDFQKISQHHDSRRVSHVGFVGSFIHA